MRRILACVAMALVGLACVADAKAVPPLDGLELVQVQVMHRHGARAAITTNNLTWVCDGAYKCGELNSEGKDMLVQLGSWLQGSYSDWLGFTPAYSQYQTFVRSTNLDRTIQSADSLLRGFFTDMTSYYPIVNTVNFDTDLLLLVDAQMSYTIPVLANKAPGFSLPDSFYSKFTDDQCREMGVEARQYEMCVKPSFTQTEKMTCMLRLQDIAASWNANGTLADGRFPKLAGAFANGLNDLRRTFNTALFVYDPSNDDMKARGSLGYGLAATIVNTMNAAVAHIAKPSPDMAPITFFDWSAHDTTYMPLASAIGFNTSDYMLPGFGQAFIFELWRKPADNTYYVAIKGGAPVQTPGTHQYTIDTYQLTGFDQNNKTVTGMFLPLDQWIRYVNSTAPTSAKGNCYLSKDVLSAIDCNTIKAPTNPNCTLYRQRCPSFACAENYVVNPADLSCVSLVDHQLMTAGSAVLMIGVTAAAGILLGGAVIQMVNILVGKKKAGNGNYDEIAQ